MSKSNRRVTEDRTGYRRIELDVDLHLEPEISLSHWGQFELAIGVSRRTSRGTFEATKLSIRIPRDTVTRLMHQIKKLHDAERAQILEDLGAVGLVPK